MGAAVPISGQMLVPTLRILLFREVYGAWTARALEHDISAEGRTLESALDTLLRITRAHIEYDRRHNRMPLSGFAAAPPLYWRAFAQASQLALPELNMGDATPAHVSAAVARQHPAVRPFAAFARTA
jgi:hypothetical protein